MRSVLYVIFRTIFVIPVRLVLRVHPKNSKNEPRRKEGPYIVCSNHQTVLDPVFLCVALRRQQPHYMGKESLFRVPVLGRIVRAFGAYPVTRGNNDVGAVKHTIALLKSGRCVGIFPQGTRCPGKDPRECPIKSGVGFMAAHTGAQILPAFIYMKDQTWKFFRRVTVVVGEPIPFEHFGYDPDRPGEYARITEEVYEEICRLGDTVKAKKK